MLRPYPFKTDGTPAACFASNSHPAEDTMKTCVAALALLAALVSAVSADPRENGDNSVPVMVNNCFIDPLTGKQVGVLEQTTTAHVAEPADLENHFWIHDRGRRNRILVDAVTRKAVKPAEPVFVADGKKLKRIAGVGDPSDEGGKPEALRGKPWECELPGRVLVEKTSWFVESGDRLYIAYEGGVARLNNLNGAIAWTSPGATGSLYS